ncbi:MAG: hypothetical protein K0U89_04545 [Planctomycetes bacterium]|nr:hypothetical protein [Planctomycetota bacterium]
MVALTNHLLNRHALGQADKILKQAEISLAKRQPGPAINELKWLLKYDSENEKAIFLLGQGYYDSKEYSAALKQFSRISKGSQYYGPSLLNVAKSCLQTAQMEQAEEALENYLVLYPSALSARIELQWLYFNQFRIREAKHLLRQGLLHAENPYPLLYHLLHLEFKPPIAQESIRLLQRINQDAPDQSSVLMALGYCHWKLGKTDQAIALIEESLSTEPFRVESILIAADFYLELGEKEKCAALLKPPQSYPAEIQELLQQDDRWHWIQSRLLFQNHLQNESLKEIQTAIELKPFEIKYLQYCGTIFQAMGQLEKARQFFNRAKTLSLSHRELYKIVSSGVLKQPTKTDCLRISQYCENLGNIDQGREWQKIAAALQ